MRYAAVIRVSEQCSPDDFEWRIYIKEIWEETTLRELLDWQKTTWKHRQDIQKSEYFHPMTIHEMD